MMSDLVVLMYADVGAPLARTIFFASDAQGAEGFEQEGGAGGWGLVAADIDDDLARRCLMVGLKPGLIAVKLSGEYRGAARPDLSFRRRTPFTLLPQELFDEKN